MLPTFTDTKSDRLISGFNFWVDRASEIVVTWKTEADAFNPINNMTEQEHLQLVTDIATHLHMASLHK